MIVNKAEYRMLLVAPFGPKAAGGGLTTRTLAGLDDLDAVMAQLAGTFRVDLPAAVGDVRAVDVSVARMADWRPAGLAANCPLLARILAAATLCDEAPRQGLSPAQLAARLGADYPELPLDLGLAAASAAPDAPGASPKAESTVDAILGMVAGSAASPAPAVSGGLSAASAWKARLAGWAALVLGAILADPALRAAEAAWRGVRRLLAEAGPDCGLRLELVGSDTATLAEDLPRLAERFAATPPHLILLDAALDAAPARLATWQVLVDLADSLLVPVAVALEPGFFHLEQWSDLSRLGHPARALEEPGLAKWRKLAAEPGGAWLAALFVRAAVRAAYGPENPARVAAVSEDGPLWSSPVWLLGAAVAGSLGRCGWPTRFEAGAGLRLGDLAVTVSGGRAMAVETLVADDRLLDFAASGLTPLGGRAGGDEAYFLRGVTLDGTPLAVQLFLSRVLGFFFDCRAKGQLAGDDPAALASALVERLAAFFESTGQAAPADLAIDPVPGPDGVRLDIRFTPPRGLVPLSGPVAFSFLW